jgi:4-amino-4-deoxy-L-arabinose transferase
MSRKNLFYAILPVLFAVLLVNLNGWGVLEASEARYAEVSREMFRSGDYLHPTLLNIYHYHKPPITYAITALGLKLFGVNGFGARFFLQVALVTQCVLIYRIALKLLGSNAKAAIASLIYIALPMSVMSVRNLTTDAFLNTFQLAAIYCLMVFRLDGKMSGLYGAAVWMGIGFLTKGPAAIVFPVPMWIYLQLTYPSKRAKPELHHWLAAGGSFVAIAVSWYVYLCVQNPEFTEYFLWKHIVLRVASAETFDRDKPWWFYLAVFAIANLPWVAVFLVGLFKERKHLWSNPIVRMSWFWIVAPIAFFSLASSKLTFYILPVSAGLAIVTAHLLGELSPPALARLTMPILGFYGIVGTILLAVPLVVADIHPSIATVAISGTMLIFLAAMACWRTKMELGMKMALTSALFMMMLVAYSSYFLGRNELLVSGTRPIANFIQRENLAELPIVVYNEFLPSLAFNLYKDIITINNGNIERELQFQQNNDWKQFLIQVDDPVAVTDLKRLVEKPSVLVVQGELPEQWDWLQARYPFSQTFDRWRVFYDRNPRS